MEYLIIDASSSYNGHIGQTVLNQFKAIVSTHSLNLEVCTATGLFALWSDRNATHKCFVTARTEVEHDADNVAGRKEGESSKKLQPQGEYESFTMDVDYPDR